MKTKFILVAIIFLGIFAFVKSSLAAQTITFPFTESFNQPECSDTWTPYETWTCTPGNTTYLISTGSDPSTTVPAGLETQITSNANRPGSPGA
jgi:hypothetical protein